MKSINKDRQNSIDYVIEKSAPVITEILGKLVENKWTELTSHQNTIKRLKRKGDRTRAKEVMLLFDQISRAEVEKDSSSISSMLQKSDQLIREGIVGSDDMVSSNFLHRGSQVANCVGRIVQRETREPLATGFMVSPNLLMTNNHVLPDAMEAERCAVQFDYLVYHSGKPIEINEFRLQPERFFMTGGEDFDYTLVAVESMNSKGQDLTSFGQISLIEDTGKATKGERLNIIHHPQGKPQQATFRKNLMITHDESLIRIFYMTDTQSGSSGSPMLNDQWELVALHYASTEITDKEQKKLFLQHMYDNHPEMVSEFNKEVRVNVGMRISAIVNHINTMKEGRSITDQALIEELLQAGSTTSNELKVKPYRQRALVSQDTTSLPFSGAPVNLNINIGNTSYGGPSTSTYPMGADVSSDSIANRKDGDDMKLELFNKKLNSQKSVFKALLFLEKARNTAYLPEESEIMVNKKSYYGDIIQKVDDNALSEKQCYETLQDLLSGSLQLATRFPDMEIDLESLFDRISLDTLVEESNLSYARARAHLYTWVDLQEDRMLKGVYTQAIIAPEQLMLKDLIQALDLDVPLPGRFSNNQYLNCEHIVPKSLFNHDHLGVSDLHHLITAEGGTNNYRSNRPYRDLGNSGQEGPDSLPIYMEVGGKRTDKFFEPKNNKGLVARATLYFIVAHKHKLSKQHYDANAIKTLISWSKNQPPTPYERHRNEAIFDIQGNRNPFIDFPEWVDKVDFLPGVK